MSTVNESGYRTFQATAVAIAKNLRVAVDSDGKIAVSGAANDWIGMTIEDVLANGYTTVRLRSTPGTHFFTASAAITSGNRLYPTAAGKVDDAGTTGGSIGFVAIESATTDGDIIECSPIDTGSALTLGDGQNIPLGTSTGTKIGTATTQKLGFWNATPVVQPSSANQTAVTDSTGGSVADAIAAVVTAPTAIGATLTDSTGGSGTHDDTLADGLTATDPAGLTAAALTDNGGGQAADGTIADIASADATETCDRSVIADAVKELSDQINKNTADVAAIHAAVLLVIDDLTVQNQNDSDLAQKVIELVTAQAADRLAIIALTDGLAKTLELTNQLRADLVTVGIIKGSA